MRFQSPKSFFVIILTLSVVSFAGFSALKTGSKPEELIADDVKEKLAELKSSVMSMQAAAGNSATRNIIEYQFYVLREKYKKIEFIICYINPATAEYLNGANLVSGDPNVLSTAMIQPRGMQVMEGMIFSGVEQLNYNVIHTLCKQMLSDITIFEQQLHHTTFSTTMLLDACRKEILRIAFLGLTGFDSPVAKNSIPEAISAMQYLQHVIAVYTTSAGNNTVIHDVSIRFHEAIAYLQSNTDFNSFNRLHFIREHSNMLYSALLDLHESIGAAYPEALQPFTLSVNYRARNPFSEYFLNPLYYNIHKIDAPTDARIQLGKFLFYDPVLSENSKRACASCHQPAKAFTDGLVKSTAFNLSGTVQRNAPTLINAALQGSYFYDVRAQFPETQIDHVVFSKDEFNTTYEAIIKKLDAMPAYVSLFQQAFPDQPGTAINGFTITKAIADYVRSLLAIDSEFDRYMRHELTGIPESVQNGFNLFMGKAQCGTCHFAPTFYGTVPPDFTESETEVLGVPAFADTLHAQIDTDKGRYNIQNVPVYMHAFKTPTVRNSQLTAPYMHNGVYATLEEVMDFYNRGGAAGLGIEMENQTLPADKLQLTSAEIADIIAFMHSLTDTSGITSAPAFLPRSNDDAAFTGRKIGGDY
jgi:cytochrome c peroxidase